MEVWLQPLYMFQAYDINIQVASMMQDNPVLALTDAFTKLLQNNLTIPHTVIWLTGESLAEDFNIIHSGEILQYFFHIIKSMKRAIFSRRQQLPRKAIPEFKTRFMISRMTPKCKPFSEENRFKTRRRGYNFASVNFCNRVDVELINIELLTSKDRKDFDNFGFLSQSGVEKLWKSVSEALRRCDKKLINEKYSLDFNPNKPVATVKPSAAANTSTHSEYAGEADDEEETALTRADPNPHRQQQDQPSEMQVIDQDGRLITIPIYHTVAHRNQNSAFPDSTRRIDHHQQGYGNTQNHNDVYSRLGRRQGRRGYQHRGRGRYHHQRGPSIFKGFKDYH